MATIDLASILTHETQEPTWLVKHMIPRGTLVTLAGEPGVGKSVLSYALAYSVATNQRFLDHPTIQTKVLYLDEENSYPDFTEYNQWVWRGLGRPGIEALAEFLRLEHFSLKPAWRVQLISVVEKYRPGLIIVDTATPALAIKDENDNAEASQAIQGLRAVQKAADNNTSIIVLKHEKQRDESSHRRTVRGAKTWLGAVDQTLYHVIPNGARRRGDGLRRSQLEPDKLRAFGLKYTVAIEPSWRKDDPKGLILKGQIIMPKEKSHAPDEANT